MKNMIKRLMLLAMCLTVPAGIAACRAQEEGGPEQPPFPGGGEGGRTYVIRVACNSETSRAENVIRAADRLTEQLAAEGSGDVVKAEYIIVPDDQYEQQIAVWNKAGDLPELLVTPGNRMAKFADAGLLIPADDVTGGEVYRSKVPAYILEMGMVGDTMYGVTQDIEARPVWVFKPALERLGWSAEQIAAFPEAVAAGAFTQDDLQALAKQSVEQGITEWGIIHRPTNGAEFRMMHMIQGAEPLVDGKVVIDRSAMIDFLTYLRENVEMGLCPAQLTTYSWDIIEGDLQPNGKTLCWYGGVWNKYDMMNAANVTPEYIDENFILILPPVKSRGERPFTFSAPQFYNLTQQAKSDERLYQYICRTLEIVLDPDIQMNTTVATSHLAITQETADYPEYREDKFLSNATYLLEYTRALPGDVVLSHFYGNDFFAAIQAAEMTADPVDKIADTFIQNVSDQIGADNYILQD